MNLFIGLCFGIASAVALVIMWRMAEHLRKEVQSRDADPAQKDTAIRKEAAKDVGTGAFHWPGH